MENPVPTWHSVRIAANLMPLTPLAASSGNIVLTVYGSWNDMRRHVLQSCVHPLTGETGIHCKAMAPRGCSGDGGEA